MTYFKHSSWKISTWLPAGRERRGRLREPSRAVPRRLLPKPVWLSRSQPGLGWMPQVANQGGSFKPAADLLATSQPSPALAQRTRSG